VDTVLQIEGLSVSYGSLRILKDVSFSLHQGDSLAIIGESGAGKTTLGKCILRLADGDVSGKIMFRKRASWI
jgi:ABC-type oligopeptide transport system ATPase subunit